MADLSTLGLKIVAAAARYIPWKRTVRACAIGNIVLNGLQTVDGVVLANGDRVLAPLQTIAADRNVWIVNAIGAWTIAPDCIDGYAVQGAFLQVDAGTANKNTFWQQKADGVLVGTDAQDWAVLTLGGGGGGGNATETPDVAFTSASGIYNAGTLTVAHGLGKRVVRVDVQDNNGKLIGPTEQTYGDDDTQTVDLTGWHPIPGTWHYRAH